MVGLAGLFRTSICSIPLGPSHEHFREIFKIAPSDFVEPTTCRSVDPFVALPLPSPLIEMQRLLESLRHRTPHDQLGRGIHFASSFPMSVDYLFIRERSGSFGRMRDAQRLLLRAVASDSQLSGSLCTFRRCTGGLAQDCHGSSSRSEGFPEFIPFTSRLAPRRHLFSMSPLH